MLSNNLHDAINYIRISVSTMKKSVLKKLYDNVIDILADQSCDCKFSHWYSAILDLIDSKMYKPPADKPKKTPPTNLCHIFFDNKGIEKINLAKIFHDPSILNAIPSVAKKFETPTVIYKLSQTTGSKIFNFNKFVRGLDVGSFLKDNTSLPCNCRNSPFIDKHHGHIMTGDLRFIQNSKLRKLFTQGPKYREPRVDNWTEARKCILDGVNACASKWCSDHKKNSVVLNSWVKSVMSLVDKKIELLKARPVHNVSAVLDDHKCCNALKRLQSNFVIAPIDKATGNVAVICKRFYASVLVNELGLSSDSSTETYKALSSSKDQIIKSQKKTLKRKFNLDVNSENECLPQIYWLPKMYKNPTKFRFIIAAPKCAIKPLSKSIISIFKLFYSQIETYNKKSHFYSGVKTFWIVQNNEPVINSLKKLTSRKRGKCMSTFRRGKSKSKDDKNEQKDGTCYEAGAF